MEEEGGSVTSVLVITDQPATTAAVRSAIDSVPGARVVGAVSGSDPIALQGAGQPELVVLGDVQTAGHALARLAELRRVAPAAKAVVVSSRCDAGWLADVLRASAAAVVPGTLEPRALALILRDVVEPRRPRRLRWMRAAPNEPQMEGMTP
jgi:DNA-binding NarL/FixJ family response regulator